MLKKINEFGSKNAGIIGIVMLIIALCAILLDLHNIKTNNNVINPQKSEKDLSLTLDYNNPLIIKKSKSNKLKIYYENSEVVNPYSVSITIENTGKKTIKNKDFIEPIMITVDDNVIIKDAYVSNSSNKYLSKEVSDSIKFEPNKLIISNFLINPEEKITVNMITNNKASNFIVNSRFDGIKDVRIFNSQKEQNDKLKKAIEKQEKNRKKYSYIVLSVFFSYVFVCLIISIKNDIKRKKLIEKFRCLGIDINCNERYINKFLYILNDYYLKLKQEDLSEEEIKSKVNGYYEEWKSTIDLLNKYSDYFSKNH